MRYSTKEEFLNDVRENCPILIDMRALDPQITDKHEQQLWYTYNQHMDTVDKKNDLLSKLLAVRIDRDRYHHQVAQLQNDARNFGSGIFLGASTACVIVSGLWAAFAA